MKSSSLSLTEESVQSPTPSLFSQIAIFIVRIYQYVISPAIRILLITFQGHYSACKHSPTCSQYTIHQIQIHGTITGLKLGLKRIAQCR